MFDARGYYLHGQATHHHVRFIEGGHRHLALRPRRAVRGVRVAVAHRIFFLRCSGGHGNFCGIFRGYVGRQIDRSMDRSIDGDRQTDRSIDRYIEYPQDQTNPLVLQIKPQIWVLEWSPFKKKPRPLTSLNGEQNRTPKCTHDGVLKSYSCKP